MALNPTQTISLYDKVRIAGVSMGGFRLGQQEVVGSEIAVLEDHGARRKTRLFVPASPS